MYYNLINSMSRGAVALDADVINFLNANLITDTTYINALNTMVLGLKADGLYDGIQCWHIFYGNANQSKYNFINQSLYQLTFFGSGTIDNNGFLGNGTNAYATTGFIPSAIQNVNSNGLTIVSRTNNTPVTSDAIEFGALFSGNSYIWVKNPNTTLFAGASLNGNVGTFSQADSKGIYTATKTSATVTNIFKNSVGRTPFSSGGTLPTSELYIGTINFNGSPYTNGWTNQQLTMAMAHEGFSDAQIVLLHSRLDTFENALGRKTW